MLNQLFNLNNYFINPYAIPVAVVGLLILSIGLFVLKQNKKSLINISFFYECCSISLWLSTISIVYFCLIPRVAIIWYRYFTFLGVINIMPSLILFSSAWLGRIKQRKRLIIANYLIVFFFYFLAISSDKIIYPYDLRRYFWGFYPIYGSWTPLFLLHFCIQAVIGYGSLYLAHRNEKNPTRKKQIGWIGIANAIGFTAIIDFLPKIFPLEFYPYGYISLFIFIALVAYTIVRYRSFDIETVVHKTAIWLLSFLFILMPLFALQRWVSPLTKESSTLQAGLWIICFLIFSFYLRVFQPRIDHFFQRRRSDLEKISNRFSEDLVHLKGIAQLIQRIKDTIADTLYPQQIDIYIYDENNKIYGLASSLHKTQKLQEISEKDKFLQWLAENNKITYKEFIDIDPLYSAIRSLANAYFKHMNAWLVVPLALDRRLMGFINLGRKSNLKRYSAAEINFLITLKNQSTIAISNSLLYDNIENQVQQRTHELLVVQKQLIQAEKLATMGTLAGGVAHEINNPLTAILTNVQMLLASDELTNDKESLELIEEATKRCRTIVQKLMTYAKKPLESGTMNKVDLLRVVTNVVSFLGYQLEQDNIKIQTNASKDDFSMLGNQNELEQVVTNLILNAKDAIKEIKKSGTIQIALSMNDEYINLKFEDEGVGISQEKLSKIFDPFFTTKEIGKGVGLGLSICQSIIENHGGKITVQSKANRGSIFLIRLPKEK